MKTAILLRGYLYKLHHKHWTRKYYTIDHIINIENIKNQILNNDNIDLYLVSYKNDKYDEEYIKNTFNPKNFLLLDDNNEIKQMDCLQKGIEMIKNAEIEYDNLLITRFDLYFKKNIYNLNYDYDKINFIWREINDNTNTGDALHFINYKLIDIFLEGIKKCSYKTCCHYLNKYIDDKYINIIFKDNYWSNTDDVENILYHIQRIKHRRFY